MAIWSRNVKCSLVRKTGEHRTELKENPAASISFIVNDLSKSCCTDLEYLTPKQYDYAKGSEILM